MTHLTPVDRPTPPQNFGPEFFEKHIFEK